MNARSKTALLVLCLLAPMTALANVGTPLVWAGMFHLVLGNSIIGALEGLLITRLFRLQGTTKAVITMMAANYFSACAGAVVISSLVNRYQGDILGSQPLYHAGLLLWTIGLTSFALTLVLELPFCLALLWRSERCFPKALLACLLAQTVSYACLVPYYLNASRISLITRTTFDSSLSFAKHGNAWIYFLGTEDGDLHRIRLDGTGLAKVQAADITNSRARLYWQPIGEGQDMELHAIKGNTGRGIETQLLLTRSSAKCSIWQDEYHKDTTFNFGRPATLGASSKETTSWTGFWSAEGLTIRDKTSCKTTFVAFEIPFVMDWRARNATLLPGDQLVYQLGDQIVLLDLPTRKIGFITMGRGPVVVMDDEPSPESLNSR